LSVTSDAEANRTYIAMHESHGMIQIKSQRICVKLRVRCARYIFSILLSEMEIDAHESLFFFFCKKKCNCFLVGHYNADFQRKLSFN